VDGFALDWRKVVNRPALVAGHHVERAGDAGWLEYRITLSTRTEMLGLARHLYMYGRLALMWCPVQAVSATAI
jgi:hypothetical protein